MPSHSHPSESLPRPPLSLPPSLPAGYVADFEGHPRVEQSTKNIQLVRWSPGGSDQEAASQAIAFQFCRTGRDEFAMDFAGPLSTLAAFAIALSCMDDKLVYSLG